LSGGKDITSVGAKIWVKIGENLLNLVEILRQLDLRDLQKIWKKLGYDTTSIGPSEPM